MAKVGRERAPHPMLEKTAAGLVPVTPFDAEEIDGAKLGQLYDLVPRSERSLPQLRLYWSVLTAIVNATGAWATRSHLHEVTVKECGFVVEVWNPFRQESQLERDSIALDAMTHDEANVFVTTAFEKLSAWLTFDCMELLPKRGRK